MAQARKRRRIVALVIAMAWLAAGTASAQETRAPATRGQSSVNTRAAEAQIESGMLVTGSVDIAADGSVAAYTIDQPERLPPGIVAFLGRQVPAWRFVPVKVDGRAARVSSAMRIRIGARALPGADGDVEVGIRSASFDDNRPRGIAAVAMPPPPYPVRAARGNITGSVYLLLRVGPDGNVVDVFAEQVNLRVLGSPKQMAVGRSALGDAAVEAARAWRFTVTPQAIAEGDGHVHVRVPVDFSLGSPRPAEYGIWDRYVRGPVTRAPWQAEPVDARASPDAQVAGTLQVDGAGPRLLTPLGEG